MLRGKLRLPLAALLVFLLLVMAGQVKAQAPGWTLQTVTGTAGIGDCPVMQRDAGGRLHILYYNTTLKSLFYVKSSGAGWTTPLEVDPSHAGHMLCLGGLALQSNGQPAVVYVTDDSHLFYVPMVNFAFQPQEIVLGLSGAMHSPNLTFDPGDSPLIVMAQNTNLVYVTPSGGGWTHETPPKNSAGDPVLIGDHSPINIIRDAQGNVHLSYYCMKHYPWYLLRTPSGFVLPVRLDLDIENDATPSVALALDPSGQPHVAATVGTSPQLRFYSRACASITCAWSGQVIDQLPDTAPTSEISGVRMVYEPFGRLLLTYYYRDNSGTAGLRLQTYDGQTWKKTMIDPRVGYGLRSTLVASGSQAYAAYFGGTGGVMLASGQAVPLPLQNFNYWFPLVGK